MPQLFRNNAFSALGASLTNAATTLTVSTGHGDRFPAVVAPNFFMLTLQDASNNIEIVRVTARTAGADSMTIVRAQEGTTARAWSIGDVAELRLTAFALNPLSLLEGASTAADIRGVLDIPTRNGGDASGNWAINISGSSGSTTGNAATATVLQNARTINGTSFNGDSNITTQNWGTARTLTIGSTGKSVNGSADVSWSLSEIGAFPSGGGSMPGALGIGGSSAPVTTLDVQTTGANVLTSVFTTGLSDLNFRLGAMNGIAGSTGTTQGKLGLFYLGTGEVATIDFLRGATSTDGSFAFRTSGITRATLNNSGDFAITGAMILADGSSMRTTARGLFRKDNPNIVAFSKTGNGTAVTSSAIYLEINGSVLVIPSGTSISMPTLVSGTDYSIWANPSGTLQATSNHTSPPVAGSRRIGGFHYAPGGNATGQSGGNTTAQINEFSFWDLKWRPACADPRGMTLVAGGFWADIYLTGVEAITNGSSRFNVTMADGSSPPRVPTMFGGNGSTTYGSYTWFEAMELATAFGKRCPTQQEFMTLAYGTTEASSVGSDQGSTILNAAYTSRWGVIQASGVLYVWGRDRGGPFAGASWNANTEGRGSEYNAPNSALFGGLWDNGSNAGSRCSVWSVAASVSTDGFGSRFVASHLQID
jgi:hypothetical protein